jgi:hypothetical protein
MKAFRKDFISVDTAYGIISDVPQIGWQEYRPFWIPTVKSMAEVIIENKFHPYPASDSRPDGIVASGQYWESYRRFNNTSIIYEAKRFVELLKQKKDFSKSIKNFNKGSGVDWLSPKSIHLLGSRIYGFYYTLKPILIEVKEMDGTWLRVRLKSPLK